MRSVTEMDREWAESLAGHTLNENEVLEVVQEYNDYINWITAEMENYCETYHF